ncbi:MAG: YDG domain-containing protein, partial [Bacteroidales bacterium]|nr:YDG domain-containing protein [Bacteroidales bacterium]
YPYLSYQSAPAYINYLYRDSVSLHLLNAADSVVVYTCKANEGLTRLQKIIPQQGAGLYDLNSTIGDTLMFVAYEGNKPPSYPVYDVVVKRKITVVSKGEKDLETGIRWQTITYGDTPDDEFGTIGALSDGHTISGSLTPETTVADFSTSNHIKVGRYGFVISDVKIVDASNTDVTGDYIVTVSISDSLEVTPKQLGHDIKVADKEYDGTTDAEVEWGGLTDIEENGSGTSDIVSLVPAFELAFDDPNAGDNKPVQVVDGGWALTGVDHENYTLPPPDDLRATITPKDINKTSIEKIPGQTYTGSDIEPEPVIKDGDYLLVKDKDYTVTYADNRNAGIANTDSAVITIEGKGNYEGTITKKFFIEKAHLVLTLSPETVPYTGEYLRITEAVITTTENSDVHLDARAIGIIVKYTYEPDDAPGTALIDSVRNIGIYKVSALTTGNNNYFGAVSGEVRYEIYPAPPEIWTVTVNEENISLEMLHADLLCSDETEARIAVTAPEYVSVEFYGAGERLPATHSGNLWELAVPMERPQVRTVNIKAISGTRDTTYVLTLEKRFDFTEIVITRWGNTMTVLPSARDMTFTACKWFKKPSGGSDFEMIKEGSRSYTAGNDGTPLHPYDLYYVEVTTETGEVIRSCEHAPDLNSGTVRIYPNPVRAGSSFTLEVSDSELRNNAVLSVYGVSGEPAGQQPITDPVTTLTAPSSAGIYLYVIQTGDGFRKELKVSVVAW